MSTVPAGARLPVSAGGGDGPLGLGDLPGELDGAGFELPLWRRALAGRAPRLGLAVLAVIVLVTITAPLIVSLLGLPNPDRQSIELLNAFGAPSGPSWAHPFGVDPLGRDVLSRLLYGGRVSLVVSAAATLIAVVVGTVVGTAAGYFGGWLDAVISRMIEVALCFPVLLLALGLATACSSNAGCLGGTVRPGVGLVTLVIAVAGWPYLARLVRAQAQALREREFVQAARCAGVGHLTVVRRDIVPNLAGPVSVFTAYALPGNLLFEASLAYLGVGVPPPTPTWGGMLADSTDTFTTAWWYFLAPTVAIAMTAIAFNLVAEGFRDALDPRRR